MPKPLIVTRYFNAEWVETQNLASLLETVTARITELEEEHGGEEGAFAELDKINKATVTAQLRVYSHDVETQNFASLRESEILQEWLTLYNRQTDLKRDLKNAETALDELAYAKYPALTESEIKTLVVNDKWLATLDAAIHGEMDRISQALTQRVKELAERYETPMPQMTNRVAELEQKVNAHLERMGFAIHREGRMKNG